MEATEWAARAVQRSASRPVSQVRSARGPMTEGDEWSKAFKATPLKSTGGARQVVTV